MKNNRAIEGQLFGAEDNDMEVKKSKAGSKDAGKNMLRVRKSAETALVQVEDVRKEILAVMQEASTYDAAMGAKLLFDKDEISFKHERDTEITENGMKVSEILVAEGIRREEIPLSEKQNIIAEAFTGTAGAIIVLSIVVFVLLWALGWLRYWFG